MKIKYRVGHKTYRFDTAKAGLPSVTLQMTVLSGNLSEISNDRLMSLYKNQAAFLYPIPYFSYSRSDMLCIMAEMEQRRLAEPEMTPDIVIGRELPS
jgi:hypothetical protein